MRTSWKMMVGDEASAKRVIEVISDEKTEETSLLEGGGALMQPLEHASTLTRVEG
jgi:hypothetical protein